VSFSNAPLASQRIILIMLFDADAYVMLVFEMFAGAAAMTQQLRMHPWLAR
jgi:hypothetical protein